MSDVSITIQGLDDLIKNIQQAPDVSKKELRTAFINSALIVQRRAKELVPVDTSNLQKQIVFQQSIAGKGLDAIIIANTNYAVHVEYGTKYMRAQPYMRPAAKQSEGKIESQFNRAAENIAKHIAK